MSSKKLKVENWPIDKLIPYARNPRKNDQAVEQVAAAIKEFGFRVPIVAKSDGLLVDGHLRLKAAQKLGLKEVPVVLADDLSDAQIKAFRISVNRMSELAEWDNELLALEFSELKDLGFDTSLTGFDTFELKQIETIPDEQEQISSNNESEVIADVKFSEYIGESNNYVVLLFNNDIDWLAAREHFDLQTVASTRRTGEKWSTGIGRVIDGGTYLSRLKNGK
jgi:hypothetical protein